MNNKIRLKNASWSFGNKVPKKFESHITKSVPYYNEGHELIGHISDFFLKKKSNFYDLGCSTGKLIRIISNRHKNKKINFFGIDSVKEMINQAKKEQKKTQKNKNSIYFKKSNIVDYPLLKNDLFVSYYTLQFINPSIRQNIINKIYKSLNWGGAFIMFEKVRGPDARFQDMMNLLYHEFKILNNFSSDEIIQKSRSLKGIMEPFSDKGNLDLLKRAGFKDITPIFQWICFKGYLCIK